ncbi:MAG: T9SS type A sorting domain-containing protein, partial [Bacteroidales bacterium]|nr:T9SS type A sorting domain-containing protein [Bacteroidales bacterium]
FCCTDNGVFFSYDYMVGFKNNKKQTSEIFIFPNPARNYINIKISPLYIYNNEISVKILNSSGKTIDKISSEFNPTGDYVLKWDKGILSPGIYYCIIRNDKQTTVKKFIIK